MTGRGPMLLAVALIALAGLTPGQASALEGSTDPGITVYGACGHDWKAKPSHRCHKGEKIGAFFRSDTGDATYAICIQFPNGRSACAENQQASQGELFVNNITDGTVGVAQIYWYVNSVVVGHWTLELLPRPLVPQFGIQALIVSRTHRLAGFIARHVPERLRVRAWRGCGGICPLGLRLVSQRGDTRRYRIIGRNRLYRFRLGALLYVEVDAPGRFDHDVHVWGRLFTGKLVSSNGRHSRDTAFRRVGPLLCVPPGGGFESATSCDNVP